MQHSDTTLRPSRWAWFLQSALASLHRPQQVYICLLSGCCLGKSAVPHLPSCTCFSLICWAQPSPALFDTAMLSCDPNLPSPSPVLPLPSLPCHALLHILNLTALQAVLLWADADPATRAPHIPQLCDRVPAPKLHKLLEGVQQLPCTPDVKAAVLQWVQSQQHDLKAASSGSTGCTLDDFSRHHQPGHGQLLIAGGHDVTWQSLRSSLSFFCPSHLLCVHTQCMQQHNDTAHNLANPQVSYTCFSNIGLVFCCHVQRRCNDPGSTVMRSRPACY